MGSDNGLSPVRRQAIIWTSTDILSIRSLRKRFSESSMEIKTGPFKKMRFKLSSAKWRPSCLCLNALTYSIGCTHMYFSRWWWTSLNNSLDSAIRATIAHIAYLIWPGQKAQGVEPHFELRIDTKKNRRQSSFLSHRIQFPDTLPGKFQFSFSWLEVWIVAVY